MCSRFKILDIINLEQSLQFKIGTIFRYIDNIKEVVKRFHLRRSLM